MFNAMIEYQNKRTGSWVKGAWRLWWTAAAVTSAKNVGSKKIEAVSKGYN